MQEITTTIGQKLLDELQDKLKEDLNSVKLAEGAIQGVQMFHSRLLQEISDREKATQQSQEVIEMERKIEESQKNRKPVISKARKASRKNAK